MGSEADLLICRSTRYSEKLRAFSTIPNGRSSHYASRSDKAWRSLRGSGTLGVLSVVISQFVDRGAVTEYVVTQLVCARKSPPCKWAKRRQVNARLW